ncbi:MAG: hypothetical protein N3I86_02535 [Verrucomicrobiae bacterium]|nr:hypothetical protein [Verrucomicrobiae bacterium]
MALPLEEAEEIENLHAFCKKYAPYADLADACIVRLSELYPKAVVLTVDREHFRIYRRFRNQIIPCDFGPAR